MNGHHSAFPAYSTGHAAADYGLTKRELIAAMAMQAILTGTGKLTCKYVGTTAVEYADALIAELSK